MTIPRGIGFAADGRAVMVDGFNASYIAVTNDGTIYATDSSAGKAWLINRDGTKTLLDEGLESNWHRVVARRIVVGRDGKPHALGLHFRVRPDGDDGKSFLGSCARLGR